MRKGLKNLVAVAVALLGVNAMAMAPTVSDIPSPVIGDFDGSTGTGVFVYEDAFDLNVLVNDDFTTDGGILWSFEDATGTYVINNVLSLTGSDSVIQPPVSKQIQANTDPDDIDADPYTVTLRDNLASPVGGPNVDPGPNNAQGFARSAVVTLWASDGTTAGNNSTIFYTDNGGEDRISGGFQPYVSLDFTSGNQGWTYNAGLDGSMSEDTGGSGLCVTAVLSDVAIEGYRSDATAPYELADNSVYRIRTQLSSTAAAGAVPIIQYTINNTTADAGTGFSAGFGYGGEFFNVDAQGSANSVPTRGGSGYEWNYIPAQAQVSNWRSATGGAFDPANDGVNDFRMEFNLFDIDGVGNGSTAAGTICLTSLVMDRGLLSALGTGAPVYEVTTFDATNFAGGDRILGTASITGGNIVVSSTSGVMLVNLEPGVSFDPNSAASYPIPVVDNSTYLITASISAGAGATPLEIIRLNADIPSFEIIQNTYAAATNGSALGAAALPSAGGSAETYTGLYHTHTTSAGAGSGIIGNWRPSISIAQRTDVFGAGAPDATVTVESISVSPLN